MSGPVGGPELLAARKINLLAGGAHVAPSEATPERIREAVEAHNESERLEGLPDDLNPNTLDPARVMAFVNGLPRLPESILQRLAGRFLVLGAEGLLLSTSSPVDAAAIEGGYTISLPAEDETVVQPSLATSVDRARAEAVAARGEAAARAADADVATLEKSGAAAGAANARWRRFASAKVWEIAAKALADADPKDREAKKRLGEARKAVAKWVAPPWAGM